MPKSIPQLTELASAPALGDLLHMVDIDDLTGAASGTDKKVTVQTVLNAAGNLPTKATLVDADSFLLTDSEASGVSKRVTLATLKNSLNSTYLQLAGGTLTGALSVPTNGLVVGTSQLVISGGRLGINNPSPSIEVDMKGLEVNDEVFSISQSTRSTNMRILSGSSNSSYINFGTAAVTAAGRLLYSNSTNRFTIRTNNTDRVYVDSSGNITPVTTNTGQLGTSSLVWSHVYATNATLSGALTLSSIAGTAASGITFGTDTNLYRSAANTLRTDDSLVVGGNLTVRENDNGNDAAALTAGSSSGQLRLKSNGTDTIFLSGFNETNYINTGSGGKLAIGTTTAASMLTVAGDVEATGSANGVILQSPDGTRYRVKVANGGTLTVAAA